MRYKVKLSYDGSQFHGWQVQNDVRTVQEEIEKCLTKINKTKTRIIGSGRTDAKVHALGQVFHFDSAHESMDAQNWKRALSSLLPEDIRIVDVLAVDDEFHARYDAKSKEYRYYINLGDYNIFERNYCLELNEPLDIEAMREVSKQFIGTHDYSSFNASTYEEIEDQVRTIYDILIDGSHDLLEIKIIGNGFLRYMVRMIVGTLIEVGRNNIDSSFVSDNLKIKEKGSVPYRAPANALYLYSVEYD